MSGTISPNTTGGQGYATMGVDSGGMPSPLMQLLMCSALEPGDPASYQLCKEIYTYHPLGGKIVDAPIRMAQSQPRDISVGTGPDQMLVEAFKRESEKLQTDEQVAAVVRLARIYGVASLVVGVRGRVNNGPLNEETLAGKDIYFSVFDPLNMAGSMVLNQQPTDPNFLKPSDLVVQGITYHRSRCVIVLNESPIYLSWTNSAFGFVGRSVYQRALYPLKSFLQTMIADNMISRKLGLLIAKIQQPGSIVNAVMAAVQSVKRNLLKWGETENVLSIDKDEAIETLNMMNVDGAGTFARNNIIKNIANAVPMPARWITEDSLAQGFGEGKQDAAGESVYVNTMRREMQPVYEFMDNIAMHRAWDEDFFKTVQENYPEEYGAVDYQTAFFRWRDSFKAEWPNFMEETDSEKSNREKVKFDAMVQLATLMLPICDPDNKALLVQWMQDNINAQTELFPVPMSLDPMSLAEYVPPPPPGAEGGEGEPRPDAVKPPTLRVAS